MRGRSMMNRYRSWILAGLIAPGVTGCQTTAPPVPLRSPLSIKVRSAQPTGFSVQAAQPLAWVLLELDPTGRLRLLYADSGGSGPGQGPLQVSLPIDEAAIRSGRRFAPGPAPKWTQPCVAEGNEVAIDPQSGMRLYIGSECLQWGTGHVDPTPASGRGGYWMVLGAVEAPAGAALRRMLERVQPQSNPAHLAVLVAKALFGESPVTYDYSVLPIPSKQRAP